jgi:hypothetical protein
MIPVALIIVFGGLMLSLLVLWLARSASVEYSGARERLLGPGAEMLAYDLPHGQDPARLAAALRSAGFLAIEEGAGTVHRILVGCPSGRFRDRGPERAVIAAVDGVRSDRVRFSDEPEARAS